MSGDKIEINKDIKELLDSLIDEEKERVVLYAIIRDKDSERILENILENIRDEGGRKND